MVQLCDCRKRHVSDVVIDDDYDGVGARDDARPRQCITTKVGLFIAVLLVVTSIASYIVAMWQLNDAMYSVIDQRVAEKMQLMRDELKQADPGRHVVGSNKYDVTCKVEYGDQRYPNVGTFSCASVDNSFILSLTSQCSDWLRGDDNATQTDILTWNGRKYSKQRRGRCGIMFPNGMVYYNKAEDRITIGNDLLPSFTDIIEDAIIYCASFSYLDTKNMACFAGRAH